MVNNESCDVAIQYFERLSNEKIEFVPIVEKISNMDGFFGHKEVNANGYVVLTATKEEIYEGYENDFVLLNNDKLSLNL
jgi:hypothetical protein